MVNEIQIFVEGGGREKLSKVRVRAGFIGFLSPVLQSAPNVRVKVVPCGPRAEAFKAFILAFRSDPDAFNILLVDSEQMVTQSVREHLRRSEGWETSGIPDEHCHLMAQAVEAWIAADPDTLERFYGQGFQKSALPAHRDIEAVEKERLLDALNRATASTTKGRYHKIHHGPELLSRVRPEVVRKRARHCDRLFQSLEALLAG